jgi:hypothetical protein
MKLMLQINGQNGPYARLRDVCVKAWVSYVGYRGDGRAARVPKLLFQFRCSIMHIPMHGEHKFHSPDKTYLIITPYNLSKHDLNPAYLPRFGLIFENWTGFYRAYSIFV